MSPEVPFFMWLVHPQVLPDESFGSLLMRGARANWMKLFAYSELSLGGGRVWSRDPDRIVDEAALARFAAMHTLDLSRVRETTARVYEGTLFRRHNPMGNTKWLLPVGVYHGLRLRRGHQYCPECLRAGAPYYRLPWRLSFSAACLTHGRRLRDACPACGATVAYHKRDIDTASKYRPNREPITLCWACGEDLAAATPGDAPHPEAAALQTRLWVAARTGRVPYPEQDPLPGMEYADVTYQVLKLVALDARTIFLREVALEALGLPAWEPSRAPRFDDLTADDRHTALTLAGWLLQHFPRRFLNACEAAHLNASHVLRDFNHAPTWFTHSVWNRLGRKGEFPNFQRRWTRGKTPAGEVPA